MNTHEDIVNYFSQTMKEEPELSAALAAIKTLIEFIKLNNNDETLAGLRSNLKDAIDTLTKTDSSVTSISSGCELFLRFITLATLDHSDFQECKQILVKRGMLFLKKTTSSRKKIATLGNPFIRDGATILTHSRSRVVLQLIRKAVEAKKRFNVYVTESLPDSSGKQMQKELVDLGIPTTVILDSAVGYIMEKVDLVLVGAESVVESGGIINKIGSYGMAICAKTMNKPFYVFAESFKFARIYPLNQQDVPNEFKYHASKLAAADLEKEHPLVDYTPPSYITLLFTDLGIMTPSAVSDQLIQLYL